MDLDSITRRKNDHLDLAQKIQPNQNISTWFEYIRLIHQAIPLFEFSSVDPSTEFMGKRITAPVMIGALTGGTNRGLEINSRLALAAQEMNIPMMIGSQRILLEIPESQESFSIVRKNAPSIPLIANIGIAQLDSLVDIQNVDKLIQSIEANAIAVHLNLVQECIQPEGNFHFSQIFEKLQSLQDYINIPIILKETGSGLARETITRGQKQKIFYYDIAGLGGTNFALIEAERASEMKQVEKAELGQKFYNWGIPTAASVMECVSVKWKQTEIIASGGIRTGIDIAKALALGTKMCSIAQPFIELVLQKDSSQAVQAYIKEKIQELKLAMYFSGAKIPKDLLHVPRVILSPLKDWYQQRCRKLKSPIQMR